ncbi:DUF5681 domain-containing protein [Sphingomonas colocasiae]|uniref:DUF5681 domain-containing protein n=1 Tax=Sphingomonas colocasiae TaxID=1848973 RepID=A0ABS7PVU5_9SPHN|nr:DUF5681 domain-containing protein [Sphingomonas colocasiae]MBY8825490.1 DUF5681 domain-containing protein [Sphingomonas colocasiae]
MTDTARKPIFRQRPRLSQPAASATQDYEVGYGKPPKTTRFKPGQSGNPRGRPKGSPNVRTIVRDLMSEKVLVETGRGKRKVPVIMALIMRKRAEAMKGDHRSAAFLLTLYSEAVPDTTEQHSKSQSAEELSESDRAILEAYEADLARRLGKDGE